MNLLRPLRIEEGEGRSTALVAGLAFVTMAAYAIGQSGIDALFFNRIGAQALPVMYLVQGGTSFVVMLALTASLGRLGRRRAYLLAPVVLAAVVVAERVLLLTEARWTYFVLWVTGVLASLVLGIVLWGVAGTVVDTRQAKRLFPIFAAGGIFGSVVGGGLTAPLARLIGAGNLLLVWTGGLVAACILARLVLGPKAPSPIRRVARKYATPLRDMAAALLFVRRSPLLLWMTAAAILFSVLFYLLYLPYARAASDEFPRADELAGFFGLFWAASTLAAFTLSTFATNRLFARMGVAAMVLVLATLYAAAFGLLVFASGFVILLSLRFVLCTWLQGVASPGWEALTNVVPDMRRDQIRAFLNGGPQQIGTMIAGALAIFGQAAMTSSRLAAIGLAAGFLAVVAAIGIRRSYAGALLQALRLGRPEVFERPFVGHAPVLLTVDADSAVALSISMRSADVRERRLAFQIAADLPAPRRPSVVEGLHDGDPIVRLAAIRALDTSTLAGRDAVLGMVDDSDSAVAAAAAARTVGLLDDGGQPEARLRRLLAESDQAVRCAAIEQLALAPTAWQARLAFELLADRCAEVRAAALERLAEAAPDRALKPALEALEDPEPAVRLAAGRALGLTGPGGVAHVLKALEDGRRAAAGAEAVRKIKLDGRRDEVRSFVRSAAVRATEERNLAAAVPADNEASTLLRDAILDRGRRIARSGLWAATMLRARREAMGVAIASLDGGSAQVATALETLEASGDPGLVRPLIALWEPLRPRAKVDSGWLSAALQEKDPFIRQTAELVRARREGGPMTRSVTTLSPVERALFLRKVPLFADLSPIDLEHIALLLEERAYTGGEVIAAEGELGEELFIIVEGSVRVVQGRQSSERELARRGPGDVVGEMSPITQAPRVASLVAAGQVRTLTLGHREFESVLRERPQVALAVMRVLVQRLA